MAEEKKNEKAAAAKSAETADATGTTGTTGTSATAGTTGTSATAEAPAADAEPSQASQASQKSQASQNSADPVDPADPVDSADPVDAAVSPRAEKAEPSVDWKDLYARLRADFDNFKKRTARDREDTYRYAESDILGDILPTVDNLALALANAGGGKVEKAGGGGGEEGEAQVSSFVTGVQLVYDNLVKSLKDHGAEPFDSVGLDLDTERMEAIATLPSATVAEGKVSNEVKRGWMLKGKVLRAAQVVVSSGKQ